MEHHKLMVNFMLAITVVFNVTCNNMQNFKFNMGQLAGCDSGAGVLQAHNKSVTALSRVACAVFCAEAMSQCASFVFDATLEASLERCYMFPDTSDPFNDVTGLSVRFNYYNKKVITNDPCGGPADFASAAVPSCNDLPSSCQSGTYWIRPGGSSAALRMYCDMTTAGGGWTLVFRYTFIGYETFGNPTTAVTPRPNWYAPDADVSISTSPPTAECDLGAMDYALWTHFGSEFLIKSNLAHWVKCEDLIGSLAQGIDGEVRCSLVKSIPAATSCFDLETDRYLLKLNPANKGPVLHKLVPGQEAAWWASAMYYWDSLTNNHYPTHDPCSRNGANHVKNLQNPSGGIYLR